MAGLIPQTPPKYLNFPRSLYTTCRETVFWRKEDRESGKQEREGEEDAGAVFAAMVGLITMRVVDPVIALQKVEIITVIAM